MTFIASVIAKDGVAVIADSLVTTSKPVLEFDDFLKHLKSKSGSSPKPGGEVKLDAQELISLFKSKPSFTKDYEIKLFKYDNYIALTTSGNASINDKRISEIIETITEKNHKRGYSHKKIDTKISDFCAFISEEVIEHIKKHKSIDRTTFIFSYFNPKKKKAITFRVWVNNSSEKNLSEANYKFVESKASPEYEKVVCDGQNRITEGILYGHAGQILALVPSVAEQIANDFKIDHSLLTEVYLKKIVDSVIDVSEIKMFKLRDLSLQQAVNLADLLMTVEIDFQKYTEEIPLVGGVIKLAIINKDGFKFIAGNEIEKPNNV